MNQVQTGKFIAQLRREKGWSQQALGDKLGVTNKTVSRWENGNYMPDIGILEDLCSVLEININELFSGRRLDETSFKSAADQNLLISIKEAAYMRKAKKISDFFTGAGTGLLISCLYSPDNWRRIAVVIVSLTMIGIGWYYRSKHDACVAKYCG